MTSAEARRALSNQAATLSWRWTLLSWASLCHSGPSTDQLMLILILASQVSAPPLIWMSATHACSQGHQRPNLDTASCSTLGVDSDGEKEIGGPRDWDCGSPGKKGGRRDESLSWSLKVPRALNWPPPCTLPLVYIKNHICRVVVAYAFNPNTREAEAGGSLRV